MTNTRVDTIADTDTNVRVTVTVPDGNQRTLEADKVLQAIGFAPRTAGYGLEKTRVRLTERGAILIDAQMQTNVPHLYAIGDVTAKLVLAHVAEAMGIVAAEHIAGLPSVALDFAMLGSPSLLMMLGGAAAAS